MYRSYETPLRKRPCDKQSSELELSQSTVVSSSEEEESIVMTSVIVPILIFFEESDGLILVERLFG